VRDRRLPEVSHGGDIYVVSWAGTVGVFEREETETGRYTQNGERTFEAAVDGKLVALRPIEPGEQKVRTTEGGDEQTIRYADKAMKRLHEKYTRMVFKGKLKQPAVVAVPGNWRALSGE
jgi:hypothetical protein